MPQQTNPKHYATANGKDLFALMEEGLLTSEQYTGFLVGNITKYLHRAEQKNGAEDLAKAGAYLATLGVNLYGVDFGPLLLEAVGEQLDKHTQPTTIVDEDELDQSVLGVIETLNEEDLATLADAATFAVRNDHHTYKQYFYNILDDERRNVIDLTFDNNTYLDDYEDLKKYAHEIAERLSGIDTKELEAEADQVDQDEEANPVEGPEDLDTTDELKPTVLEAIETLGTSEATTLHEASLFALNNNASKYGAYYRDTIDTDAQAVIDLVFNNGTSFADYRDLQKYSSVIAKRVTDNKPEADQDEEPAKTSNRCLNLEVLSTIHALDVDELTTLAGLCDLAYNTGKGNFDYLATTPREGLDLINRITGCDADNITLDDVTDLLIQFRDHVKNHLQAISQAERVKEAKATDRVLEYLTDEANAEDFNNVRDLYREMLDAGIKDGDEARDYLTYSDNKKAKVALVRFFRNLDYSSDWADMVKYFGPVVTAQLQAEADEEAKELTKTEPELNSKLNPVELSALKKAYRDIIELDTFAERGNYLSDNDSWLGVPLLRAFDNDTYDDDVTDLLNWGVHNVTAGLPIPKSKRTDDAEHLELLNRAYRLMLLSYNKEERAKAISESSEADFSWDESRKVAHITSDLLGDNISDKISEDVITYFIDNPDQATYK